MGYGSGKDILRVEATWEDLGRALFDSKYSKTAAKVILLGASKTVNSSNFRIVSREKVIAGKARGYTAGDILYSLGEFDNEYKVKKIGGLSQNQQIDKILKKIANRFGSEAEKRIEKILKQDFDHNNGKLNSLKFGRKEVNSLRYGEVAGISGKWRREANGGSWIVYSNINKSKALKIPHAGENNWERALMILAHQQASEYLKSRPEKFITGPKNDNIVIVKVNSYRVPVIVMDYEENVLKYPQDNEAFKKTIKVLRETYNKGKLPLHGFDYTKKGIRRGNLAFRNNQYIALDLADESVLRNKKYLENHRLNAKAKKLGFSKPKSMFNPLNWF